MKLGQASTYGWSYERNYIFRVELSGEIDQGSDKLAAQHRKYLYKVDLSDKDLVNYAKQLFLLHADKCALKDFIRNRETLDTININSIIDKMCYHAKFMDQLEKKIINKYEK